MASIGGDLGIGDKLQWVASTGILRNANVIIVDVFGLLLKTNIFEHSSEFNSIIYLRLFLVAETNALGIASTFNIEHTLIGPDMFVITNQGTISDCAQSGFSCA